MENIANWSNNQENRKRMICNVKIASLSEGHFCLLSRQTYWGHQLKAVKDTSLGKVRRSLAYLVIFGAKRSHVTLVDNPASVSKEL